LRLILAKKHNGAPPAKARQILRSAVQKGEIIKPSQCEICYSTFHVQAHHNDYSKPLNVEWLCAFCHGEKHQISSSA
jgi:hypothetical protein